MKDTSKTVFSTSPTAEADAVLTALHMPPLAGRSLLLLTGIEDLIKSRNLNKAIADVHAVIEIVNQEKSRVNQENGNKKFERLGAGAKEKSFTQKRDTDGVIFDDKRVLSPDHYAPKYEGGASCLQFTADMPFNLGTAIKYIWRYQSKGTAVNDLGKAIMYLESLLTSINKMKNNESSIDNILRVANDAYFFVKYSLSYIADSIRHTFNRLK